MDFRKLRKRIQQQDTGSHSADDPPVEAHGEQLEDGTEPSSDMQICMPSTPPEDEVDIATTDEVVNEALGTDDDADETDDEADDTEDEELRDAGIAAAFLEAASVTFDDGFEVLRFRLATELFCLPLDRIDEIIKPREITPVPRTPDWLLGIVSLRGTMIPVIDTAKRLKVPSVPAQTQRIVIIEHEGERCGLLVDEVQNVEIVSAESIEPLPAALADRAGQFLEGLLRLEDQLIAMIDIEATLELEDSERR